MYAVNVILGTTKRKELQEQITGWRKTVKEYGLKINVNKTQIICNNQKSEEIGTSIEKERIDEIEELKYLNALMYGKGDMERKNTNWFSKIIWVYSTTYAFFNKHEVSKKTKTKLYQWQHCVDELWVLTDRLKSKIKSCGMKY